eukprot:UN20686
MLLRPQKSALVKVSFEISFPKVRFCKELTALSGFIFFFGYSKR